MDLTERTTHTRPTTTTVTQDDARASKANSPADDAVVCHLVEWLVFTGLWVEIEHAIFDDRWVETFLLIVQLLKFECTCNVEFVQHAEEDWASIRR